MNWIIAFYEAPIQVEVQLYGVLRDNCLLFAYLWACIYVEYATDESYNESYMNSGWFSLATEPESES